MRILVVDDEPLARARMVRLIGRIADSEVCGEAADGIEARERIRELAPDLVLLDVRMPGLDGMELALTTASLPPLIFTTAYSEHAVQAFEANAVDYLLKPVTLERLRAALDKVRRRAADPSRLASALREVLSPASPVRITAQHGETLHVFDATVIARFHAGEKYTAFTVDGQEYLTEETLNALESRLAGRGYFRCHRAELVALRAVRGLRRVDDGHVARLEDDQEARVSRRSLIAFKQALGITSL